MGEPADIRTRVAIIGGGAAGTILACRLLRLDAPMDIDVFEVRDTLGRGLAYSTADDRHVVNVPASKLSAVADEPAHFVRWLGAHRHDARDESFPRRHVYGQYLEGLLATRIARAEHCTLTHVHALVTSLRRDGDEVELRLQDRAERATYDAAVLALGNVEAPPAIDLPTDPRVFTDPWQPDALEGEDLAPGAHILVIGTGLTAVDAVLSLADTAPDATITMVSRNGQLPFAHLPGPLRAPWPSDEFPTDMADLDELLTVWDDHLARGLAAGHDWRDVVDGMRPITQAVWRALDEESQRRFLHEQRRAWEVRRNRAAPEVGTRLDELRASGRLVVRAGDVADVRAEPDGIHATVAGDELRVDRIVCCTGPTADVTETTNPLLQDLLETGLATPDPHHLAVRTSDDGELVRADGSVDPRLLTLGWMRRGELWETLAIPEIREQSQAIAALLVARVGATPPSSRR